MIMMGSRFRYYYPPKPLRIYPESKMMMDLNNDPNWIAEQKKNGWRCLIVKEDGKMSVWNRDGKRSPTMESGCKELLIYLGMTIPDNTILDGEFLDRRLQSREYKGIYYAFDILYNGGEALMHFPLYIRRDTLEKVIKPYESLWVPQWVTEDKLGYYYESLKSPENEGIVIKKLMSTWQGNYSSCKEVPTWLKVKKEGA